MDIAKGYATVWVHLLGSGVCELDFFSDSTVITSIYFNYLVNQNFFLIIFEIL
jgi:hypothetical protein